MGHLIETYRGEALAWEADDLGHLNMRYYFERAGQARTVFLATLGLPDVAKADAYSSVVVRDQHINYVAELLPGRGIIARTGILEISENELTLVHMIIAAPDTLSATVTETISHISTRTSKPFPWPKRAKDLVGKYEVDQPEGSGSRNIDLSEKPGRPTLKSARKLDLQTIGRGAFMPTECDTFGYVRPYDIIGRVSDSVQHLASGWPDIEFTGEHMMSGALLEARIIHRNRPRAGDCYVICSGLRRANTYVRELCHWILDPVSGECWASMVGVACKFDLKARRLVKNDEKILTQLKDYFVEGLGP